MRSRSIISIFLLILITNIFKQKMEEKTLKKNTKRKVQYGIAYTVALASLTSGVLISWTAPALPKIKHNETNLDIDPNGMSWIVSIESPGFMLGSLSVQYAADHLGRRFSILLSCLPTAVGTILLVFADKTWQVLVSRFLWGITCGMFSSVAIMYLAEVADKEIRGALIATYRSMFNLGTLLVMCIGPSVSYFTLNCSILALPVILFLGCLWIPESPYFLLMDGKADKAEKVLKTIRSYENDEMLKKDLQKLKADVKQDMRHSGSIKELLTSPRYRKALIVSISLRAAHRLTGQMVLSQYLGLIMLETDTTDLTILFTVFAVCRLIASVISSFITDRIGRRPLLLYSFFVTGISFAIGGIFFFCKEVLRFEKETLKPYSYVPFICILVSIIVSNLGFNSTIYVVVAEIFPLNVKALAMTFLCVFTGLTNFGVARGYQILKDASGLYGIFWFFGTAAIFGAVFTLICVPETKGKSLREIQEQFQGDMFVDDTNKVGDDRKVEVLTEFYRKLSFV